MNIVDVVKKFGVDLDKCAVFGSGPICVRGLRDFKDVDLIVTKDVFEKFKTRGKEFTTNSGNEGLLFDVDGIEVEMFYEWAPGEWNATELINDADVMDGVRFVQLDKVLEWKKIMGREKDLADIEIINKYLKIKKMDNDKKWKKYLLWLTAGLTVLAVVLTIYWKKESGVDSSDDSDSSVTSLIPIWAAAFIPLIASRNKNKAEMSEGKRKLMVGLLIGVVVLVLITLYMMFVA